MMLKVLFLFCLVALAHSFPSPADEDEQKKILSEIFGAEPSSKPSDTKVPAEDKVPEKKEDEKCTTDGKQGLCVPYYQCNVATDVIDGAGLIDIHFGDDANLCLSAIDVCCEQKNISKDIPAKEPAKPKSA